MLYETASRSTGAAALGAMDAIGGWWMASMDVRDAAEVVGVVGIVFLLYLVRAYGIAPFATLLAFDAGLNLAGVLLLRAVSDLAIAWLLYLGIVCWQRARADRPAGRVARWLARVREQIGHGNVFVNFVAANYFLNTYVVFGTVVALPQARRRAFAGALLGDLASFVIDLAAILGLSALLGGSRTTLSLAITAVTIGLAAANHLLRRRIQTTATA